MGSRKGIQNRVSTKARSAIASLIDGEFTQKEIMRLINKVERDEGAKAAFACYVQLLDFVLPKLARIEHTGKDGDQIKIEHILNTLTNDKAMLPSLESDDVIEGQYEAVMRESIE